MMGGCESVVRDTFSVFPGQNVRHAHRSGWTPGADAQARTRGCRERAQYRNTHLAVVSAKQRGRGKGARFSGQRCVRHTAHAKTRRKTSCERCRSLASGPDARRAATRPIVTGEPGLSRTARLLARQAQRHTAVRLLVKGTRVT